MARSKGGSFQNEIPPSRVNIRYVKATDGAQEEVELPLKLLMVGDYTMRADDTPLEERKKLNINKDNFEAVLKEQKIGLSVNVPNKLVEGDDGEEMKVDLKIDSMKSFEPEAIVRQIPELDTLLELRDLLKDLKGRVVNNRQFRKELEKIVTDAGQMEAIQAELGKLAPLPDVATGGAKDAGKDS
jgi:type VI secretion system protein ImpB